MTINNKQFIFSTLFISLVLLSSTVALLISAATDQQQQGIGVASCAGDETNHKKNVARFFSDTTDASLFAELKNFNKKSNYKERFCKTLPSSSSTNCKITQAKPNAAFPIYSAHHLGLTEGPSPFYVESYRDQKELSSTLDKTITFVEDKIPVFGVIVKALRAPIVMVSTHLSSFYRVLMALIAKPSASANELRRQFAPQTLELVQMLSPKSFSFSGVFRRQVIDVYVKDSNTKLPISIKDGVVNAEVIPLPSDVSKCSDIKNFHVARERSGHSKSVTCRSPGAINFNSPAFFANSVFGWIPRVLERLSTGGTYYDQNGRPEASAPTCSIDTTLFSAEPVTQCLVLQCSSYTSCASHAPQVQIYQRVELDVAVFALLIGSYLFSYLRPFASRSAIVRWVLCSLFGVAVLTIMLSLLVYKLIENNNTMKIGIAISVGFSGLYAASSGIIGHLVSTLAEFITSSPTAFMIFAALCVLSVYLAHNFFGSSMPTIINITMITAEWFFRTAAILRNTELCFTLVALYFCYRYVLIGFIFGTLNYFFGTDLGAWLSNDPDRPRDKLPQAAYTAAPDGVIPSKALSNPIGWGMSSNSKMKMFDNVGNQHTNNELTKLYKELNEHPEKYVNVLKNPNQVFNTAKKHKDLRERT